MIEEVLKQQDGVLGKLIADRNELKQNETLDSSTLRDTCVVKNGFDPIKSPFPNWYSVEGAQITISVYQERIHKIRGTQIVLTRRSRTFSI